MAVDKREVTLYYDVLSPYTYIGFEILTRCKRQWASMDLKLKPVLISAIMEGTGNQSPGLLPARSKYLRKDLYRISEYYGVEFKFPKDVFDTMLNKGSLKAMRLLTVISKEHPELLEEVSRQLFRRIWLKDADITEDDSLKEACMSANIAGDLATKLVAMASDNSVKDALKEATREALNHGTFGLPSYVVEHKGKQQMMFGTDRMFLLAHYLGEKFPVSKL